MIDITTAIRYLDAVQVSPRRWEYFASETRTFWRLTRKDLEALAEALADAPYDAYCRWCAGGNGVEVRPSKASIDRTWSIDP